MRNNKLMLSARRAVFSFMCELLTFRKNCCFLVEIGGRMCYNIMNNNIFEEKTDAVLPQSCPFTEK